MRKILDEFDFAKNLNNRVKGVTTTSEKFGDIEKISAKLSKNNSLGRFVGEYLTYNVAILEEKNYNKLLNLITSGLISLIKNKPQKILIAGMGNPLIVSDALGPKTLEQIDVQINKNIKVAKICPDVSQNSGIDSIDVIKSMVICFNPDLLLVVDSLCASDLTRVGKSFQLSNAGIIPGSGMGQQECVLTKKTLGCEVIAIGVPTVINLLSLINKLNIKNSSTLNLRNLDEYFDMIIAPKDVDVIIFNSSKLIASVIINTLKTI